MPVPIPWTQRQTLDLRTDPCTQKYGLSKPNTLQELRTLVQQVNGTDDFFAMCIRW